MSATKVLILAILVIAGTLVGTSCSDPKPTKGTLGITVIKASDGSPIQSELLYIANSLQNLKTRNYLDSNWTDATGQFRFRQKDPGIYWYKAKQWEDFGAARVMNGIDVDVILLVNTPDTTRSK